jgi:hypothetical protein
MLKPMLEDYHLSAVNSWLFNILAVIVHIWGFSNWYVKMSYVEVTTEGELYFSCNYFLLSYIQLVTRQCRSCQRFTIWDINKHGVEEVNGFEFMIFPVKNMLF